jgi:flagellar motor switch protein FliN/FliY
MNDTTENPNPEDTSDEALDAEAKASSEETKAPEKPPLGPSPDDFEMSNPGNIDPEVLQNISVSLAIEVGRTQIKIKDLMRLTQGSVVELDRIAGEPLDLLVNDTVVAQGEVVLVNDRYGIRLTRVVPSSDRLKSL